MSDPQNKLDLDLLVRVARSAGAIAKNHFEAGDIKSWDKSENHPVTDADIAVNDHLQDVLLKARKNYGWLSEETNDDRSRQTTKRSFIIDPIDGTRAFINRLPHFTICLGVMEDGKCVAGVVYNPMTDEMFKAVIGGGSFLNDIAIKPSTYSDIQNCTMIGYPRKFKKLDWPAMDVCIRNSMAYRIVMVASGLRDATIAFTQKSDWDLAAASLIATEAGTIITDIEGDTFDFTTDSTVNNGVICAGPCLHALLLTKVKAGLAGKPSNLETKMSDRSQDKKKPTQLLHIVIGGELIDPMKTEFMDLTQLEYIGAYPNYRTAYDAWKKAAQTTVDNAHMRFFILHAHELIDPDNDGIIG